VLAAAGLLLAIVIAGCGGSGSSAPPTSGVASAPHRYAAPARAPAGGSDRNKHAAPSTEVKAPAAAPQSNGIPQNNGGDRDADNNGGPSDGDGNI
jgi:hypothetical protein